MILVTEKSLYVAHFGPAHYDGRRGTVCVFHKGLCRSTPGVEKFAGCGLPIGERNVAYSYCSRKDQFKKDTGRKVALARALKAYHFANNRVLPDWMSWVSERVQIWKEYGKVTHAVWIQD